MIRNRLPSALNLRHSIKRLGVALAAFGVLVLLPVGIFVVRAATTDVWQGGSSTAWFTSGNWAGGLPAVGDIAQFGANGTSTSISVTMSGSVNNGTANEAVGAVDILSTRANALTLKNDAASTNGTFTLNGALVTLADASTMSDVVVHNNSSKTLTLSNGTSTMGVALNDATNNVISIESSGGVTISSIISGAGKKLTKGGAGSGVLTLSGADTYSGDTTINAGTLALSGSGSIANSPNIILAGGSTFDVSTLTTPLTLASGQGLRANGAATAGTIGTASGKGLALASNSPLQFTAFDGVHAPLTISGAGSVTLASGNSVTVTASNGGVPLTAGAYTLISKGASGSVNGTAPSSVTVNGDGLAPLTTASLSITGNQLVLNVTALPASALKFRSKQSGNWNATSTWEESSDGTTWVNAVTTPDSTDDAITIRSGHVVAVTANVAADQLTVNAGGILSVNSGVTFTVADGAGTDLTVAYAGGAGGILAAAGQITNSGQAQIAGALRIDQNGFPGGGAGTYAYDQTTGALFFNNTSGPYGVDNFNFWPASNGPQIVSVGTGGVTMNVARTVGVSFDTSSGVGGANNLTLNGTFTIFAGGSVSGSPTYGANSILKYSTGGTYGRAGEWLPNAASGAGYPANVQISANTTLNLANGGATAQPFQMSGSLTVDSGSKLDMTGGGSTPLTAALTVLGNVTNNGTLTLSTSAGGDLHLQGGISNGGTFTPNNRAVFFEGGNLQTVSDGATFTMAMPYVRVNKTGGTVKLLTPTIALAPAGGDSVQFANSTSTLTLNGVKLTLGSTVGAAPAGAGFIGDSLGSELSLQDGGAAGAMGTIPFVAGSQQVSVLTVNRTGVSGSVALGSDLLVKTALNLTSGVINTGANTLTVDTFGAVSRNAGYVLGAERKNFTDTSSFTFDVGTANGYTPVDANSTTGTGSLSVKPAQTKQPNVAGANALARYWTLNGSGVTTNLTFHYLAGDVAGTEADYKIFEYGGGAFTQLAPTPLDTVNHAATANGVSTFSDWTLAESASVFGRLQFSASNYDDTEGDSGSHLVTVTVERAGGSSGAVSVHYATSDGSATAGSDYTAASGTLDWGDGDAADKTFDVVIAGDSLYEGPETFNVTLSGPTGDASLGPQSSATVTINDDDAPPATLTVNTTDDEDFGACLASHCSLREAINAANYDPDASTINFQIPSSDAGCDPTSHVCTITPQSDLPAVTGRADIDGYSQTNASANTLTDGEDAAILIHLDGLGTNPFIQSADRAALAPAGRRSAPNAGAKQSSAKRVSANRVPHGRVSAKRSAAAHVLDCGCSSGDGLVLAADHSSVRGLVVTRFAGAGVHVTASYCTVAGNFIGTDPSGLLTADGDGINFGNGLAGVLVDSPSGQSAHNNIGGTSPADRNVVSGSFFDGVTIDGANTSANSVLGNFIGTDKTGANAEDGDGNSFGNGGAGVIVYDARDNQIGAAAADPTHIGPNVVAANYEEGVEVETGATASASGNLIQGNFIGTDLTAARNLGNYGDGVTVCHDASGNTVGGAGEGNVIAYNGFNGVTVTVDSKQANVISQNSIFENYLLGIDLGGDGVTGNDSQPHDAGPNFYQNFPVIDSASVSDSASAVKGSLISTPSATFTIEFFANASCDDSGNGEGQTYVGSLTDQTTDANGDLSFTFNPSSPLTIGQFITATATNATSGTSEFSQCAEVKDGAAGQIVFSLSSYAVNENDASGVAQIAVTRTGGSSGRISATFSTSDDTATAGSDYTAVNAATVTFDDGETGPKNIEVTILDDNLYEGDESLNLDLSTTSTPSAATSVNNAKLKVVRTNVVKTGGVKSNAAKHNVVRPGATSAVGTTHATLTITDDETPPSFGVNDVFVARPQSGSSTAKFTVKLSGPAQAAVSVPYATADDTAHQPADYASTSGTLDFASGETEQTVSVPVNSGGSGTKTFVLGLTSASAPLSISDDTGQATIVDPVSAGQVIISEFRFRGPAGARDEFVELYNATQNPITVAAEDGSPGWGLAAIGPDGTSVDLLTTIPGGTVIPARAHFLVADVPAASPASGYSLGVTPDLTYDRDISDGAGVGLFNTNVVASLPTATRFDAAGFSDLATPEAALFREGAGLASPGASGGEYSFVRDLATGLPKDTDKNAEDFRFVSTDAGSYGGVQSVLGAPGPENSGSPLNRGALVKSTLFDHAVTLNDAPNRERFSVSVANGAHGTLVLRRTFNNKTADTVKKLRFRVVDVTTAPQAKGNGTADLRLLDTAQGSVSVSGGGGKSWVAMPLETTPAQPDGGGYNSAVVATLPGGGLAPSDSINIQFTLGVQQTGSFRFFVIVEALLDSDPTTAADAPSPPRHGPDKPSASKPSSAKPRKGGDAVKID